MRSDFSLNNNLFNGVYCIVFVLFLKNKKNLNASRPSEHAPVRGGNVKTFRWNHRLQKRQNLFIAFKRVRSPMVVTLGQQYNIGEKPTGCAVHFLH